MSLLMEALRKAEEAKHKGGKEPDHDQQLDQPDAEVELGLQESEPDADLVDAPADSAEASDLQADFDAALSNAPQSAGEAGSLEMEESVSEPELGLESRGADLDLTSDKSKIDLDLEQVGDVEGESSSPWKELDLHPIQEGSESEAGASLALDAESSPEAPEGATPDEPLSPSPLSVEMDAQESTQNTLIDDYAPDFPEQDELAGEEDPEEVNAWKSRARKISNPRDYRKIAFAIIILLLLVGGGLFWYLGSEPAPQIATPNPDRGFLGGPDPLEQSQLEDSPLETGSQESVLGQESLPENALVAISEEGGSESFVIGGDLDSEFQPSLDTNSSNRSFSQIERSEVFQITSPSTRSSELSDLQSEASAAAQSGYNSHAREQYEWLLTAEPNNSEALLGLARLDAGEGNAEAARERYLRLLELNPADPIARAGLLNLGQGDPLSQEAELKSLAQRYPDVAPLSFALGNLLASQRRWNEAEGAYSRALNSAKASGDQQLSPDYSFNLAVALEQLNRPDEAYVTYIEALELSNEMAPSFDLDLLTSRIRQLGQKIQ